LVRTRPELVFLIDIGKSTAICAVVARLLGAKVIVDTGDLAFALARSTGSRSVLGLATVWLGERLTYLSASHVIVRGRAHLRFIRRKPATYAPDLAPPTACLSPAQALRERLGLKDSFIVGMVGSLQFAPRLGTCYGWDLIEALPHTPSHVFALIVGGGDGLPRLRARAAQLGVSERCRLVGPVPSAEVSEWISAMDVGLSTQSNDSVGAVRTTGKLPLYLACGCPVLASDVGEAKRLLGPLGWTIPYDGVVDRSYPTKLAAAVSRWARDPAGAADRRRQALEIASRAFNEDEVRRRVLSVVETELSR
jgi:glycosyltransferase involved in cell wall biosynthesis